MTGPTSENVTLMALRAIEDGVRRLVVRMWLRRMSGPISITLDGRRGRAQ